ncbi:MAG: NAD(P)-dependent oxidoreductase [Rhizobiales bacterium]|nr:NAD(P)-dependent oxidoreductase [Hyphomicrobiales bacterium]
MADRVGYIGLGAMGAPMVENMLAGGLEVVVFDKAGTAGRAPDGATIAARLQDVASRCETIFVCVPDGAASLTVAEDIISAKDRQVRVLVNLSTTGIDAAGKIAALVDDAGIAFADAPVSGGRAGAVKGTITIMWSGPEALLDDLRPALETFTGNAFFVGSRPGQGQAMKLLNNYLSAMAMAATSEAMAFGEAQGLDMKTMLDVVNVSTGRNTATSDKFVNRVMPGTFDAGFRMALMEKDVSLYMEAVRAAGSPDKLGNVLAQYWRDGVGAFPDGDFTEIFKLVKGD